VPTVAGKPNCSRLQLCLSAAQNYCGNWTVSNALRFVWQTTIFVARFRRRLRHGFGTGSSCFKLARQTQMKHLAAAAANGAWLANLILLAPNKESKCKHRPIFQCLSTMAPVTIFRGSRSLRSRSVSRTCQLRCSTLWLEHPDNRLSARDGRAIASAVRSPKRCWLRFYKCFEASNLRGLLECASSST
jgi:hypothetical protein